MTNLASRTASHSVCAKRGTPAKLTIMAAIPGFAIAAGVAETAEASSLTAHLISGSAHIIGAETILEQQLHDLNIGIALPQPSLESNADFTGLKLVLGDEAGPGKPLGKQAYGAAAADDNAAEAQAGKSDQQSANDLAEILSEMRQMRSELSEQKQLIADQKALIEAQNEKIKQLENRSALAQNVPQGILQNIPQSGENPWSLSDIRGAGMQDTARTGSAANSAAPSNQGASLPNAPVGEAPPEDNSVAADVMAVPVAQGVLTPKGSTVIEPSIEYTRTSRNRLVFRGFELIPGLQVGLIEASDADRDTIIGTLAARHGLTRRLEIEARLPTLYRNDRFQVVQQRDQGIVREFKLRDYHIGDAEVAVRYQLNEARGPDRPIYVASLRVKSNTGKGPFDIGYDEFGIATGLATGSGFWGVQGGLSFLLPSDPVVIYGGTSYLYHIPANVDKLVGGAFVGRVDPGDAISGNLGFGFALNPRFSFSLGYGHSYIVPTKTEIGGTNQKSTSLNVGSFSVGASYRISQKQPLNVAFEFGMTSDAPDVSVSLRFPLRF
jgi:hypothetical protein